MASLMTALPGELWCMPELQQATLQCWLTVTVQACEARQGWCIGNRKSQADATAVMTGIEPVREPELAIYTEQKLLDAAGQYCTIADMWPAALLHQANLPV